MLRERSVTIATLWTVFLLPAIATLWIPLPQLRSQLCEQLAIATPWKTLVRTAMLGERFFDHRNLVNNS